MADADSMDARISPECPAETREILQAAWNHDATALRKLLDTPGKASLQDPKTRETPLHAAIRACGPAPPAPAPAAAAAAAEDELDKVEEAAKDAVGELFLSGAIWNDVDDHDETPGCVALRLGHRALYRMCVDAGVRAELLFALMDGGYEELSSDDEEEEEEEDGEDEEKAEATKEASEEKEEDKEEEPHATTITTATEQQDNDEEVTSKAYLRSRLTYNDNKLLDDRGNGVMMAWETDIMRRSVAALLPPENGDGDEGDPSSEQQKQQQQQQPASGKRILNIGFGMGIIDTLFAATRPARHHIVEAHPDVLARLSSSTSPSSSSDPSSTSSDPASSFGPSWSSSGPTPAAYAVHPGRWQDVCPSLLASGEVYDAIYFDTFGEDYTALRHFFTELVPGLLDSGGRFGFFNGLGADRQVCHDVYQRVVEAHLADAGLDVAWDEVDVDLDGLGGGLGEEGKGEWEGVRRRYWTLDKYRLPVCTFMG